MRRGDRVLVKNREIRRNDAQVTVGGEVAFPGAYPISLGKTKLSDLIRLAGGLLENALPGGSVLWRKAEKYTVPDAAQLEYLTYLRAHQFSMVDSLYFFLDLKLARQPVVVQFDKLLAKKDSTYCVHMGTVASSLLSQIPSLSNKGKLTVGILHDRQHEELTELIVHLALRGPFHLIVGGEWLPDQDSLRRSVGRHTTAVAEVLEHPILGRPSTCLQLRDQLEKANDQPHPYLS